MSYEHVLHENTMKERDAQIARNKRKEQKVKKKSWKKQDNKRKKNT
jgi:hypothetical protein